MFVFQIHSMLEFPMFMLDDMLISDSWNSKFVFDKSSGKEEEQSFPFGHALNNIVKTAWEGKQSMGSPTVSD